MFSITIQIVLYLKGTSVLKEKKTEKDLSILDTENKETEVSEEITAETAAVESTEGAETTAKVKKPIKPWILITSAALIIAIALVGFFTWRSVNVLATYDGGTITRDELNRTIEILKISQGVTDEQITDEYKDGLLEAIAKDEIFYYQLEALGMGQLTEQEVTDLETEARGLLDSYIDANLDTIIMGLAEGYDETDFARAKQEYELNLLNQNGYIDYDDFLKQVIKDEVFTKAYENYPPLADIEPTDEEVFSEYESLLNSQVVTYQDDPSTYIMDKESIELPLYVPEGIRTVRHVLFLIDEETLTEIQTLESEGKEDEAKVLLDEALAAIEPTATEVLQKINDGEITFSDAITEYGEDPGMPLTPEGYELCKDYPYFVEEFVVGSMSLEKVGDVSGLVSSNYGYHIIEYYSDIPTEVVPYEDVQETLYAGLMNSKKSAYWLELFESWPEELNLEYTNKALNEDTSAEAQ